MTDNVVSLPAPGPRRRAPDRRVVGLLEDLLAQALTGRVRTVAVATLCEADEVEGLLTVLHWVDEPSLAMALSGAVGKMSREIAEG